MDVDQEEEQEEIFHMDPVARPLQPVPVPPNTPEEVHATDVPMQDVPPGHTPAPQAWRPVSFQSSLQQPQLQQRAAPVYYARQHADPKPAPPVCVRLKPGWSS